MNLVTGLMLDHARRCFVAVLRSALAQGADPQEMLIETWRLVAEVVLVVEGEG